MIGVCYTQASENGWHDEERPLWQPAHKIGEEAHELLDAIFLDQWADFDAVVDKESYIQHAKESVETELADIVIRCFDLAGHYNIDLVEAITWKLLYNKTRGYKHGKLA